MKKMTLTASALLLLLSSFGSGSYKDAAMTPEQRADELLSQLTLGEKVAQLKNYAFPYVKSYTNDKGEVNVDSLKKYFPYGVGGLNIAIDLDPEVYVNVANSINRYNATRRVYIPTMFIGEGLHGYMSNKATVFPQAIALGSCWDPALLEKVYSATALEASSRGVKTLLSPVLDLAREPRFGRIEEFYSEDPYLVGVYGRAAVYGFQGHTALPDNDHVACTLKHFMGHGMPEGGRNTAPVNISQYDLMNDHFLPFEMCLNSGALSIMPSYNEINGVPNHGSKWLLMDLLRNQMNFKGLVQSDQNAIDPMCYSHSIVPTMEDAAKLALENGIDIDLRYTQGTFDQLEKMVKEGKVDESLVNQAVKRMLVLKFQLGLFEQKSIDPKRMKEVTNCEAHKKLALEAAEKSLVLLKNEGNVLPFNSQSIKRVAVVGPMAKGVHFGGYTAEPRHGVDVVDGVKALSNNQFEVVYAEGCKIAKEESSFWRDDVQTPNDESSDNQLITEAVQAAQKSDVIVLAIGETVAFSREAWAESHTGDRDNLDLLGRQNQLVEALAKTGKPIVALMFGGRPLSFNTVNEKVPAIIQVFYPGQEGGTAIANVLFGKVNPSGKLAVTIPKSVGQLPCYYDRKPSRARSYVYSVGVNNLYPFGYGLSYTRYEYSNLTIEKKEIAANESVKVSVQVKNSGKVAGDEVVQLYIRDVVSAGVRPVMELKDFAKVSLQPGESKTVIFEITPDKLMYYNPDLKKVLEPGDFNVMVGPSSAKVQTVSFKVK